MTLNPKKSTIENKYFASARKKFKIKHIFFRVHCFFFSKIIQHNQHVCIRSGTNGLIYIVCIGSRIPLILWVEDGSVKLNAAGLKKVTFKL